MAEPGGGPLEAEFAAYRAAVVPDIHPAGPTAVRETVRRRRRRAVTIVAAVTLLAVALPVAALATQGRDAGPPDGPAHTQDPSPTAPAPTPSPGATASPTPSGTPGAPDGRVSRQQLLAATVDLPAWNRGRSDCAERGARLRDRVVDDGDLVLAALAHGDVDADGATETVALVRCVIGTGGPAQVVAFDRDAQGRIVTMGQVVRSDRDKPQWLDGLVVRADGAVQVRVADYAPGGGWPIEQSIMQWRAYRWGGGRFSQAEGPTTFPPNPAASPPNSPSAAPPEPAVTLRAEILLYGARQDDGWRVGSMAVEIGSAGWAVQYPLVTFPRTERDEAHLPLWEYCVAVVERPETVTCVAEPLRAGERRWTLFPFRSRADGPDGTGTVRLDVGADRTGTVKESGRSATFEVRFDG